VKQCASRLSFAWAGWMAAVNLVKQTGWCVFFISWGRECSAWRTAIKTRVTRASSGGMGRRCRAPDGDSTGAGVVFVGAEEARETVHQNRSDAKSRAR